MKKFFITLMLAVLAIIFTGCSQNTAQQTTVQQTTTHQHSFSEATCLKPATCTKCGETSGAALGHDWKAATCTEPQICKICNTIGESAKGHNYSNGKCISCYASDPNYKTPEQVFSAVKAYIQKYGSTSSAGNNEYYISSNLTAVYRSSTDSILFRYQHYVSGYTIFNVNVAIFSNSNDFEISLSAAPSGASFFSQDINMKKTSLTTNTQVNITKAGYRNQQCSQEATTALRESLPDIERFLQQQDLSLNEWGFTNY